MRETRSGKDVIWVGSSLDELKVAAQIHDARYRTRDGT